MINTINTHISPALQASNIQKSQANVLNHKCFSDVDTFSFRAQPDISQPRVPILDLMRNLVTENIDEPTLLTIKYHQLVFEDIRYKDSIEELELSLGIALAEQDNPAKNADYIFKNTSKEAFFYCIKELFNNETTQSNVKKAGKAGLNIVKNSNDPRIQEMFKQDKNLAKLSSLIKIYVDNTDYYDKKFLKSEFVKPLAKLIKQSFPWGKGFLRREIDDFFQPHVSFPDFQFPGKAKLSKRYKVF